MRRSRQDVILQGWRQINEHRGETPHADDQCLVLGCAGILPCTQELVAIDDIHLECR